MREDQIVHVRPRGLGDLDRRLEQGGHSHHDRDAQQDPSSDRDGILGDGLRGRRDHLLDQLLDVDADVPRDQELGEPQTLRLPPRRGVLVRAVDRGAEEDDQLLRERPRDVHHGLHDRRERGRRTDGAEHGGHAVAHDGGHELARKQRVGVVARPGPDATRQDADRPGGGRNVEARRDEPRPGRDPEDGEDRAQDADEHLGRGVTRLVVVGDDRPRDVLGDVARAAGRSCRPERETGGRPRGSGRTSSPAPPRRVAGPSR